MEFNVGDLDRAARVLLGTAILLVGHYYQSYLGFLGFIPIITGLTSFCPLYIPVKINTKK